MAAGSMGVLRSLLPAASLLLLVVTSKAARYVVSAMEHMPTVQTMSQASLGDKLFVLAAAALMAQSLLPTHHCTTPLIN